MLALTPTDSEGRVEKGKREEKKKEKTGIFLPPFQVSKREGKRRRGRKGRPFFFSLLLLLLLLAIRGELTPGH